MGAIHSLSAFASGGLKGIQASQRDWSPFLVHFTSYKAMEQVRRAIEVGLSPNDLAAELAKADRDSFDVVREIARLGRLLCSHPAGKMEIPECVCLSECSLPGIIGLAERYGRFGFVFQKYDVFTKGGRPCAYLGREEYAVVSRLATGALPNSPEWRLFGLSNLYSPPGTGRVQDFTHEREWRFFAELSFTAVRPVALIAPESYIGQVRAEFGNDAIYIPLDTLFIWGA